MRLCRWILLAAVCLCSAGLSAQVPDIHERAVADRDVAAGLDGLYDMSPKASTPAPKGYEAVYVSHYGRHGSRYAYTHKTYSLPLAMLREGDASGNLTPFGKKLLAKLEGFWEEGQYKVGDLTPMGWAQHRYIAETMVSSFPAAFGRGSVVDACSSGSVRSIISMTSCVSAISRKAPEADVYAHQGILDIQATRPNHGSDNPFRYTGPQFDFPYSETPEEFFLRKLPGYRDILARLFIDTDACMKGRHPHGYGGVFFYLYMLEAGMRSVPEEERIDLEGLFTPEEFAILWEADNYERFREYLPYRTSCSSVVDDIMARADTRLQEGSRGADLRFGHDHVLCSLLSILNIDGFGTIPDNPDELAVWFCTVRSPMATNLQFVFYRPRRGKSGDVLVKVLLNGEEALLGDLKPFSGPYYNWEDAKAYMNSRTALFVTNKKAIN